MHLKTAVSRRTCRSEENTASAWDACVAPVRNMRLMDNGSTPSTITAKAPIPILSAWKECLMAELMTSMRVALVGKRSSGPRRCPGPLSGQISPSFSARKKHAMKLAFRTNQRRS